MADSLGIGCRLPWKRASRGVLLPFFLATSALRPATRTQQLPAPQPLSSRGSYPAHLHPSVATGQPLSSLVPRSPGTSRLRGSAVWAPLPDRWGRGRGDAGTRGGLALGGGLSARACLCAATESGKRLQGRLSGGYPGPGSAPPWTQCSWRTTS